MKDKQELPRQKKARAFLAGVGAGGEETSQEVRKELPSSGLVMTGEEGPEPTLCTLTQLTGRMREDPNPR